jgi:hypothetical protein
MQKLAEHLRNCQSCRELKASWSGVEQVFREARPVGPSPGFSQRWQVRLAEQQLQVQRRQSLKLLSFTGGSALILLILMVMSTIELLRSPYNLVLLSVYRMFSFLLAAEETRQAIIAFSDALFRSIPEAVWPALGIGIVLAGTLWIVVYHQLTSPRRIKL